MRKNPFDAIPPGNKSDKLFKLMHDQVESGTIAPNELVKKVREIVKDRKDNGGNRNFKTSAGAMDEWQKRQEK